MAQIFLSVFEFEIAKARQQFLYKCSLPLFIFPYLSARCESAVTRFSFFTIYTD